MAQSKPYAMNSLELLRLIDSGGETTSGIGVNTETALRLMTVHNCVRVLYNCISQWPCQLMEDINRVKDKARNHPVYNLIGKRPNRWMSPPEFWGMMLAHVLLRGNAYAYKSGLPGREILELIPLGDMVIEVIQNEDWSLDYKVQFKNGEQKTIPGDKIMHIRGLVMNGYMGINPIQYARESIGIGIASDKFMGSYFGKGMHPGMIVTHPGKLSAQGHSNLSNALKDTHAGLGRAHELMLMDEGMTADFPKISLADAQFLELGKFKQAEICGMFGVPLMLVQAGDNPATYASATEFKRTFVDFVCTPIAVNFESAINRDLLSVKDQSTYYAKFNLNSFMRGNTTERFAAYGVAIDKEIMNPNECRDLEDMNPYQGGEIYKTRTSTVSNPGQAVTK